MNSPIFSDIRKHGSSKDDIEETDFRNKSASFIGIFLLRYV
jgi:hypothetical protein